MNTLEQTIVNQAKNRLAVVSAYYGQGGVSEEDIHEFTADTAQLLALLEIWHISGSGMSAEGIAALEAVEADYAALVRSNSDREMTVTLDAEAVEALSHYRQALSAFQAVGHGTDEGADLFLTSEKAAEELGRLIADLAPATTGHAHLREEVAILPDYVAPATTTN
ncbi:hypothetical protein [Pseudomonas fragi]|uniref:hypothetical protein n=1 Tax=Pseudomonas fragi TaxID=296 RepID=UPI001474A352|nr:hypothetical protein [Pseudomonas fragi]NNB33892.1 hypothetical protein [Pseudomonas fragi]